MFVRRQVHSRQLSALKKAVFVKLNQMIQHPSWCEVYMKLLLFSGSLRKESLNKKLLNVIAKNLQENKDLQIEIADIKALSIPVYDGDVEAAGIPDGVKQLGNMISDANAVIICSPEYNGSIAGPLKNTIDWISRLRPVPLDKKPLLLTGASPGGFGAIRALGFTRAPLEAVGSFVFPQSFALPKAHEAFGPEGKLLDAGTEKRLAETLKNFIEFARKF